MYIIIIIIIREPSLCVLLSYSNPLTPELNPSVQRRLTRYFIGAFTS
jgi:hypothetical protein